MKQHLLALLLFFLVLAGILLVAMCGLSEAADPISIFADSTCSAYIWRQSIATCPGAPWAAESISTTDDNEIGINIPAGIVYYYARGLWQWSLDHPDLEGEEVDSARVTMVVFNKGNVTFDPSVEWYRGDGEVGSGCGTGIELADSSACTDHIITYLWADFPADDDSFFISITADMIPDLGAGHCFDIRGKLPTAQEQQICDCSGVNGIWPYDTSAPDAWKRPRLDIWLVESESETPDTEAARFSNSAIARPMTRDELNRLSFPHSRIGVR